MKTVFEICIFSRSWSGVVFFSNQCDNIFHLAYIFHWFAENVLSVHEVIYVESIERRRALLLSMVESKDRLRYESVFT